MSARQKKTWREFHADNILVRMAKYEVMFFFVRPPPLPSTLRSLRTAFSCDLWRRLPKKLCQILRFGALCRCFRFSNCVSLLLCSFRDPRIPANPKIFHILTFSIFGRFWLWLLFLVLFSSEKLQDTALTAGIHQQLGGG